MPRIDYLEWWKRRIDILKGKSEEAKKSFPQFAELAEKIENEEVGAWAFLKLLSLAYYISVYTTIIRNQKVIKQMMYIDLCAGGGFNKIKDINEVIAGSPILAKMVPRKKTKEGKSKHFDLIILNDKDKRKATQLKQIFAEDENVIVFNKDVNDPEMMEFIKEKYSSVRSHYLAFIDPYGLYVHWKTIEELLKLDGDIIINCMTSSLQRTWGSYHSLKTQKQKKISYKKTLNDFFGSEDWLNIPNPREGGKITELIEIYRENINKHREIVKAINIRGLKGQYGYVMFIGTKRTKGAQGWLEAIDRVKNYVERVNNDYKIKLLFDIYNGKQQTLRDITSKNEVQKATGNKKIKDKKRVRQRKLNDFFRKEII